MICSSVKAILAPNDGAIGQKMFLTTKGRRQQSATDSASTLLLLQSGLSRLCGHFPLSFANVWLFRFAVVAARARNID
jgi:hypothetical protein